MKKLTIFLIILLFFTLAACSSANENTNQSEGSELIISAAASLTDVADDLQEKFNEKYPHIRLHYNFGGSGKLAQQIKQGGAPVDIFMSASIEDMAGLSESGLIVEETITDFAKNEIVLITHDSNEIQMEEIAEIVNQDIDYIAIGDVESVPIGRYAKQALDALDLWELVEEKVVFSNSANQILSYVEQGNAQLGIVFATDAMRGKNIKVVANVDPSLHDEIIYPAAVINTSDALDAANLYLNFLESDEGKSILQTHGFITK